MELVGCEDIETRSHEALASLVVHEYLDNKGIDTTHELDMYEVFTQGVNVNTEFDSLEQLFAYLKFVVNGFNGNGM